MKKEINHICPKCNFYICSSIEKHINFCDGRGPRRKIKRGKRGGWNKGINYREKFGNEWTDEYLEKLSNGIKRSHKEGKGVIKNEAERREKISIKMKEVGGGYRKGSGRGKKGWYKGYWCDSSWELAWVIYSLDNSVEFTRNLDYFEYEHLGEKHKYLPDFKIENKYIEIKGYITDQFISKMKYFEKEIDIIDKNKIKPIIEYVNNKYGKDFIKLYE